MNQAVLNLDKPLEEPANASRLETGIGLLKQIELDLGNEHGLLHGMRVHAPSFKQKTIELFGEFYAGDQAVDLKTKLLLAVAFASCQPSEEGILEFHIGAAVKAGWSREQIVNVLEMTGFFVGWQKAIKAVQVAVQTFDKIDANGDEGKIDVAGVRS